MKEVGLVTALKGEFASVRIGRHSACGQCGKCGMSENQKHVDFFVQNSLDAKVGDSVVLDIKDINTTKLALVAHAIPLAFAMLFFVIGLCLKLPDWANFLMFVGGCAVAYTVIAIIDKRKKHKWMQSPEMVEIVKLNKEANK